MKTAFISDVHGNEIALRACLAAIHRLRVDLVHFLGDAVGYLPGEIAVLEQLEAEGIACQQGNHEAMLLAERLPAQARDRVYRLAPARARLLETPHWARIRGWPTRIAREFGDKRVLLVHGSPTDELFGYVYEDTDLAAFADTEADAVVMANTHRPWIREAGGKTYVNTGSVGLPRDHGTLAAFALFDSDTDGWRIVRVPIDVAEIGRRYGNEIAPEVVQCFSRRVDHPVGELAP